MSVIGTEADFNAAQCLRERHLLFNLRERHLSEVTAFTWRATTSGNCCRSLERLVADSTEEFAAERRHHRRRSAKI